MLKARFVKVYRSDKLYGNAVEKLAIPMNAALPLYTCIIFKMKFTGLWNMEVLSVNQNLFYYCFLIILNNINIFQNQLECQMSDLQAINSWVMDFKLILTNSDKKCIKAFSALVYFQIVRLK